MIPGSFETVAAIFAFVFGTIVGSFLNVCIYRLPLGLSVNEPRRSFCPSCKKQIPWHQNLPLISWLVLRGRCASCQAPIAFRYFFVEFLTGGMFLAIWLKSLSLGAPLIALPLAAFAALSIAATFIDFEHYIIPDELTLGGAAAGVLFSLAIPSLHGEAIWWKGGLMALAGALAGYGLLWMVVEAGKLAFGRKKVECSPPAEFRIEFSENPVLRLGEESLTWEETFSRPTDRLELTCPEAEVEGKKERDVVLRFFYDRLELADRKLALDGLSPIVGKVSQIVIPREAMGMGDVKYMAAIGAFLGWNAVIFTLVAASICGTLIALVPILMGHREWSAKIPFGPYLALGAILWIFVGPEAVRWYFSLYQPPPIY